MVVFVRMNGLVDRAVDSGAEDSRFESTVCGFKS